MREHKYYAFISYARKDGVRYAKYIQRELEHYRYPMVGIEEFRKPDDKNFLRKIFLDLNELENSEETFHQELLRKIENSKYLLVICTLESAKSKWVKSEIEHFLKTHNNDEKLIIPVLCEGKVPDNLPLPLNKTEFIERNLPSFMQFEGDYKNEAKERGLSQIIAYMLGLERGKVFDRFQLEKRKTQNRIIKICAVVTLSFAVLTGFALYERKRADDNALSAISNAQRAEKNAELAVKNEKIAKENEALAIKNEIEAKNNEKIAKENEKIAKINELAAKKKQEEQKYILDFYSMLFVEQALKSEDISLKDFILSNKNKTDMLAFEPEINAQLKLRMADMLYSVRLYDDMKDVLDEAYKIIKTLPEDKKKPMLADYYFTLSTTELKNFALKEEYLKKAISYGFNDDAKMFDAKMQVFQNYLKQEEYDLAESALLDAYNFSKKMPRYKDANDIDILFYQYMHILYQAKGDYTKSILYNNKTIALYKEMLSKGDINNEDKKEFNERLNNACIDNVKDYLSLKEYNKTLEAVQIASKNKNTKAQNAYLEYAVFVSNIKLHPNKVSLNKENYASLKESVNEAVKDVLQDKNKSKDVKTVELLAINKIKNQTLLFLENSNKDTTDYDILDMYAQFGRENVLDTANCALKLLDKSSGILKIKVLSILVAINISYTEEYLKSVDEYVQTMLEENLPLINRMLLIQEVRDM